MDFSVKNIQMGVENIENKNSVIREYFLVKMETPGTFILWPGGVSI